MNKKSVGGVASLLALGVSAAHAGEDPAVAELTQPTSTFEVGTGYVSDDSYKFGQYNGLANKGAITLGNVDLHGGGSYDSDSRTRWRLTGNDLGLDTRDAAFDFRDQGRLGFSLGYDQFTRNISDTYHTPYLGDGSSFTLPAGWIKPIVPQVSATALNFRSLSPTAGQGSVINAAGVVTAPTAAQLATVNSIAAADVPTMSNDHLRTDRKRGDVAFNAVLAPHLELTASVRHEKQDGTRPIGAPSSALTESGITLAAPIDSTTDQFNLALEYARPKGGFNFAYYGSIYRNDIDSLTWQEAADPTRTASMGTAPSSKFHQLSATGNYNPFAGTKLVADLSYGRSTQNDTLLTDASLPTGVPVSSADAKVITRRASLKLSQKLPAKVNLLVRYRYDDREDRTPVNTFVFYDVNLARVAAASPFNAALGLPANTLGSNVNIFSNRPQDKTVNAFEVSADRALGSRSRLSAGYDWEKIERECDSTWANCVNANESIERTLHAQWRVDVTERLSATARYAYAERHVHYDPNAWLALVPMANVTPGAPTVGATLSASAYLAATGLSGFGPLAGFPATALTGNAGIFSPSNNIVPQAQYGSRDNVSELPGMRRFNLADRNRDQARVSADWQATDRFSLNGSFELNKDDYEHSEYGLRSANNWAASLDADYVLGERLGVAAFYTHENQRSKVRGDGFGTNTNAAFIGRAGDTAVAGGCYATVLDKNLNGKLDPCLNWLSDTRDRADTLGASLTKSGLLGKRLDLSGEASFTRARTDVGMEGGSYSNNPFALAGAPVLATGDAAIFFIPAVDLPTVNTRIFELRFSARYAISKATTLRLTYGYERLKSSDFAYDGMQIGTATTQMPTGELAPNYSVHVVGLSYLHRY